MPRHRTALFVPLGLAWLLVSAACGGSGATFCEIARQFEQADLSGPGDLEGRMTEALAVLDELVDLAPDDIRAAVEDVRDGVEDFVTDGSAPGDQFRRASRTVSDYLDTRCAPEGSGSEQP